MLGWGRYKVGCLAVQGWMEKYRAGRRAVLRGVGAGQFGGTLRLDPSLRQPLQAAGPWLPSAPSLTCLHTGIPPFFTPLPPMHLPPPPPPCITYARTQASPFIPLPPPRPPPLHSRTQASPSPRWMRTGRRCGSPKRPTSVPPSPPLRSTSASPSRCSNTRWLVRFGVA